MCLSVREFVLFDCQFVYLSLFLNFCFVYLLFTVQCVYLFVRLLFCRVFLSFVCLFVCFFLICLCFYYPSACDVVFLCTYMCVCLLVC